MLNNQFEVGKCPVCTHEAEVRSSPGIDATDVICGNCGRFRLSGTADSIVRQYSAEEKAKVSYAVWQATKGDGVPSLGSNFLSEAIKKQLPAATVQLDNLLRYAAEESSGPGGVVYLHYADMLAKAGSLDTYSIVFIINELEKVGYVSVGDKEKDGCMVQVTFRGWERVNLLAHGARRGKNAFMAMPFEVAPVQKAFEACWVPAATEQGYTLSRVSKRPGDITQLIMAEIDASRFVVADLTGGNPGAYWEAGFVEGRGKPVIYVYSGEQKGNGTHFDTRNRYTIFYDLRNLAESRSEMSTLISSVLSNEERQNKADT